MNKGDVIFGSSRVDPSAPEGAAKGRRIWITVVCVIAFGSVLAVGLTLGLQNHEDHVLTAQITQTEADLRVLGGAGLRILRTTSSRRWRSTLPPTRRLNPC